MSSTTKRTSQSSLVPGREPQTWILALVVGAAGAFVGAVFGGLLGPAQRTPPLSLRPYVDLSWASLPVRWMAQVLESPLLEALVLGLATAALMLACDAAIRRVFLAGKPGAAALAAVVVLLAPGWGALLKLEGHSGLLVAMLCGAAGCALLIDGLRPRLGGALLAAAALLHPACLAFCPIALAGHRSRREGALIALACVALPGLAYLFGLHHDGLTLSAADRLAFGLRDLAAAPILAFSPARRLDVPTGYEAMISTAAVVAGLAVHALLLGIGMMIGGLRQALASAAGATVAVLAAALLIPGWVPGDRAFALAAMLAYAPLIALVLSAVPDRVVRAAFPGLVLGVGAVAVLLAWDRAPDWTALGAAMDFPKQRDAAAGPISSIEHERDPARLVLFLKAVSVTDGVYAATAAEAADAVLDAGAPALDRPRLKQMLDEVLHRVGRPRRTPEFKQLAKEVLDEMRLDERLWAESVPRNFDVVTQSMLQNVSKALDLAFNWGRELEGQSSAMAFVRLARIIIPSAGRAGYYEVSVPLLEAIQLIGPESSDTAATIAIQRVLMGDAEKGRAELEAVAKRVGTKGAVAGSVHGVLGIALFGAGETAAALKELQTAWNIIGAGGVQNVPLMFPADVSDYYVVAEMLLVRFQAAQAVDPALAPQAARDLAELLDSPLRYGVRRLPALAIMGKLELLRGNRARALELLREARRIPSQSFEDRSDGAVGRISHPRYRRLALETLASAIAEDPAAAVERDEIAAELRDLATK